MDKILEMREQILTAKASNMIGDLALKVISLESDIEAFKIIIQERESEIAKLREERNEKMETERELNPTEKSVEPNVPQKK